MSLVKVKAKVDSLIPLTDRILMLKLIPERYVDYYAGQYLQLLHNDDALSYSIANAPLGAHHYELHIRHQHGNPFDEPLFANMRQRGEVDIQLPLGACHIQKLDVQKPIIFIAGGTGFAPVKAMIEYLLATHDTREIAFYWGARTQSDLYREDKVKYWASHVAHFRYASFISTGQEASLASKVIQDYSNRLSQYQIVMSGPMDMVFSTRDALILAGANRENLWSDAFNEQE